MIDVATTPVQGEELLLKVSDNNGVDWYTLVCVIKQGIEQTRNVNKTNTQCGQLIGKGTIDRKIPVEGAVNVIPDDIVNNAGFASYKKMQEWFENFTSLLVDQRHPDNDGLSFANKGPAYLTDLKLDAPVDNICTFTATLDGWGAWVIV